ncbi:MAG: ADP-ribosylglycohydrolase family protein [Nitrospinae bacterium]|nr:ADP-ribosylglycohydrolase family protein [Nitrospinota bacterium]
MLGAIAGDIIGSVYENDNIKTTEFPLFQEACTFTDDSVLTIALADSIISGASYFDKLKEYYRLYPNAGYGFSFIQWAATQTSEPYHSWGNGAAMRVSPVGFAYDTLDEVLKEAAKSAEFTHDHIEGVKGAQATASAVFLARTGKSKPEIKSFIETKFEYDLDPTIDQIRKTYKLDLSCQGTVPQAMVAFLESSDYEQTIRKAISIGGDSDTLACIAGGIAHAFYKEVPDFIVDKVYSILDSRLRQTTTLFCNKYNCR